MTHCICIFSCSTGKECLKHPKIEKRHIHPLPKKLTRRRPRRSPYTGQKLIRVRPEIAELFEGVAVAENIRDAELFEEVLLAFLEQSNMKEAAKKFKDIVK